MEGRELRAIGHQVHDLGDPLVRRFLRFGFCSGGTLASLRVARNCIVATECSIDLIDDTQNEPWLRFVLLLSSRGDRVLLFERFRCQHAALVALRRVA